MKSKLQLKTPKSASTYAICTICPQPLRCYGQVHSKNVHGIMSMTTGAPLFTAYEDTSECVPTILLSPTTASTTTEPTPAPIITSNRPHPRPGKTASYSTFHWHGHQGWESTKHYKGVGGLDGVDGLLQGFLVWFS